MSETHPDAAETAQSTQKKLFTHQFQFPAATASSSSSSSSQPKDTNNKDEHVPPGYTKLPNGVILDKEGKPCRLCTSAASWRALTQKAKATPPPTTTTPTTTAPNPTAQKYGQCPPDVEELGRSTWTFLHSLTASYPAQASAEQQTEMRTFLGIFSRLYPCWVCADDFRAWMAEPSGQNAPRLAGRKEFGDWMCRAHNEVNRKLGKDEFDCRFWEERWRSGWKDGRCD
ncbi:FAD dependent sulfhydryl oxidase Erv1 [Aspergillus uvarum CBS 121591]|uniref:Sulfhydryl oxidase n=1 Tax=Aspergillus uvarum CBS 121591 TaxID=1448315 RepID=A0A319BTI3_9EURO|nr:FAD dependent sulfhydryl oxidase Erv1 [Aspergillus uvarum CBS 121591]PYH75761.1 FAD dependent sulfhydryl oxidase Erv1 [Aspergillus uvarum CBS 121591]